MWGDWLLPMYISVHIIGDGKNGKLRAFYAYHEHLNYRTKLSYSNFKYLHGSSPATYY